MNIALVIRHLRLIYNQFFFQTSLGENALLVGELDFLGFLDFKINVKL